MSVQRELSDFFDTIRSDLSERLQETLEEAADRAAKQGRKGKRRVARQVMRHNPILREEWNRQQQQEGVLAIFTFVIGLIGGAAIMYLFDPDRGARRRALLRDQVVKLGNDVQDAAGEVAQETRDRVQGVAHEVQGHLDSEPVSDQTLEARVRSEMGRYVSNPAVISVTVHDGSVILGGKILSREAAPLIARVRLVPGVKHVENRLELYEASQNTPSFQGGANGSSVQ